MQTRLQSFAGFGLAILACLAAGNSLAANSRSPFGVAVAMGSGGDPSRVRVSFEIPADCVLYAERLHFLSMDGTELVPLAMPDPVLELDKSSRQQKPVYDHSFAVYLKRSDLVENRLVVKLQGCTNAACFFPEKRWFVLQSGGTFVEVTNAPGSPSSGAFAAADWTNAVSGFKIAGRQTGYLRPSEFTAFLDRSASGQGALDDPLARFQNLGTAATLLMVLLGGFLLNFTPCVFPMIPINLAIIGAGSKAGTRVEGFKNGSWYGLGMALAYGLLGVVIVLTGARFGTLNSTVWFNAVVALVFLVLALAMFDVIQVDLSRFGGGFPRTHAVSADRWVHHLTVFAMGGMSALLAGACVAPVVISVMLLAASLYAKGRLAGLSLPFLLGAGMALPWPVAGAGFAFLPKPGRWMNWVKYGFGVLILGFAVYYGHLAGHAFALAHSGEGATLMAQAPASGNENDPSVQSNADLAAALREARATDRNVFLDFHASWCKNCQAMEETVFNQPNVQARLKDFIVVHYDAEQPNRSPTRELLDHFGVMGLPTYLVMKPTPPSKK